MVRPNGITTIPGVLYGSTSSNNIYLRPGEPLSDLTVTDLLTVQGVLNITDGTNTGTIYIDDPNMTFTSSGAMVFDPNGAGQASLTISGGSLAGDLALTSSNILQLVANNRIDIAPIGLGSNGALSVTSDAVSVTLASKTAPTQAFYCRSTPAMTARNVSGSSSGVGVDSTFLGNTQYCTITGASTSLSFSFGTGSNPLPPGGVYDFVLAPASTTGATMSFNKAGTPFYSVTATSGVAKWVRIFCDGTNLMPLVPS